MALFQRLTCVLPILGSLLSAEVITELEHDVIKQKTQTPLQARELIDTVLVKGNEAASIFRNCLRDCDPVLYKDLFGMSVFFFFLKDVSLSKSNQCYHSNLKIKKTNQMVFEYRLVK